MGALQPVIICPRPARTAGPTFEHARVPVCVWVMEGPAPRGPPFSGNLQTAHVAHDTPLGLGHRLHRQAGVLHQHHLGQILPRLDLVEGHRGRQRLHGIDIDALPSVVIRGGIRMRLGDHFDDTHDGLFGLRVVEEPQVAHLHLAHEIPRLVIADPIPFLARIAPGHLLVPGPGGGFGFEQPVMHRGHSGLRGRARRVSSAAAKSSLPSASAATMSVIGVSSVGSAAMRRAVCTPSTVIPGSTSAPVASATPYRKLRDFSDAQVSTRSPSPDSPVRVSACAPRAEATRRISAKPRAMIAARAESPSPAPMAAPAAIATTFFSAPPSSAPITSVVR